MSDFRDNYAGDQLISIGAKLSRIYWPVMLVLCMIACVGVISLYSVANGSLTPWGDTQIARFLFGLALVLLIAVVPREFWLSTAYAIYIVALGMLAITLVWGAEAGGARRWISLGHTTFQPAELMKVALILALARYYQWLPERWISHPFSIIAPALMIGCPMGLTLLQPDLGTAVFFAFVGVAIMFLAGVHILYFIIGAGGLIALLPVLLDQLHDYQRKRIETFLNPGTDPLGNGYHIAQSKIALGSGGLSGKGFMQGTQGKLDFLPEKHTDFIFTNFAEEWGFIGAIVLLGLFALLIFLLIAMSLRCANKFARLTISGAAVMMFVYVFINIAMVTGMIPVVGVPLPLISYGGTSMLAVMFAIGLAMCAYVHRSSPLLHRKLGIFW